MADSKFTHLHVHTEYSLLDGISNIKKLVKKAKALGMDSLAITDHGNMYGAIEFYKACKEAEIKPIIGCEMYVAPRNHTDKEGKIDAEPYHLTVLAKDYQGYLNLMKLVSVAWLDGYYYRPRVDRELLKKYHEGLIALSACPAGEFIRALDSGGLAKAEQVAKDYLEIFGEGNYYFEIQNHHYNDIVKTPNLDPTIRQDMENLARLQDLTWDGVKKLSAKLGIEIVATNDLHYIDKSDAEAHDAVICVQTGRFVSEINRLRMIDAPDLYLKSLEEMAQDFREIPESLVTSTKIAQKCNLEMVLGEAKFPIFPLPEGAKNSMEVLREMTYKGAKEKFGTELSDVVKERLEYELEIIDFKKYADYFLVVADFLQWAHVQGIFTNTRGSAAGSLVLYCVDVTILNPLDYLLPFERFLTKSRPTMPDIDADLADDRRDEIIHYLMSKYGEDKVAHIVTFGTMMGRAAIRDVGRVLQVPLSEVDKIAKLVPMPKQGFHIALVDHIQQVPELHDMYQKNPEYKKLLDLACKIEGTVRHASVHAAGILITPEQMTNFAPVQRDTNSDKMVSQFDMFSVVDEYGGIGLVKMDLLGIRNLSILGRAVEYVKKNQGIDVDINKIPLNDEQSSLQIGSPPNASKKTYDMLARGETMGVFQLSSSGMTRYLMELKPTSIADLAAMVALYRPGPMGIIPEYIARKNNPDLIKYLDPRMESYMKQSLGLLVYQEDVLYTAMNIAGYNWEKADKFRKAMGKKKPEEMKKQKEDFIKGCIANGMSEEKTHELYGLIEPFAAYGFGKAHAASYAMVSYQTAYMKANYPVEYMAAIMTAEYGDTDKIAEAIEECKRMVLSVLPPDINFSFVGFTVEDLKELSKDDLARQIGKPKKDAKQGIRFGLSAIKNVGISAIESIIKAREEGEFTDLVDVVSRVDNRLVNKKTLESLIKAGALDKFGRRSAQLAILDQVLEEAHKRAKAVNLNQGSLFDGLEEESGKSGKKGSLGLAKLTLPDLDEMPLEHMLSFEKDLLGFYLHEPPYLGKLKQIDPFVSVKRSGLSEEHIGKKITFGGVIMESKRIFTKKTGAEMAFIKVFDGTGNLEIVVFPKTFDIYKDNLEKETVVLISGKIDTREDDFSMIADTIDVFDAAYATRVDLTMVEIELPATADGAVLQAVNTALRRFPGEAPISVLIPRGDTFKKMNLAFTVSPGLELVESVEKILGPNTIRLI